MKTKAHRILLALAISWVLGSCSDERPAPPHEPNATEQSVLSWLEQQQQSNGLLESTEGNNFVSLYDQSLAAMAFMINDDFNRAEAIFDFFDQRRESELLVSPGGFSQFRDRNGVPGGHRWMGDNAWLLIALKQHEALSGRNDYNLLIRDLTDWLVSLQDTSDGGLWAGYDAQNQLLNYKVTEGMIDAFAGVAGYGDFHQSLLNYLENDRWNGNQSALMAWPENAPYRYALDNFSWAYCAFPSFPESTLTAADRFLNDQTTTGTNATIRGYDIDEDRDAIFMEGTGQMALAWKLSGDLVQCNVYLGALERSFVESTIHNNAGGFPYASNRGTAYGSDPYWVGADTEVAISPGTWYIFARRGFNPLSLGNEKTVPVDDRFWTE